MKHLITILLALVACAAFALLPSCAVSPDDDDDASADDDDATAGDDDDDDDDDTVGDDDDAVADDTIYDVRQGAYPDKTEVFLANVIITSPMSEGPPGFFIQEPGSESSPEYSGIFVYVNGKDNVAAVAGDVAVGNAINITAIFKDYNGLAELSLEDVANLEVTGTGTIAPVDINACDAGTGGSMMEQYESVLVRTGAATVSSENPDGPDDDYGEFEVEGCLRVDDLFVEENPAMGTTFTSITGPMYYSWENAKITPRTTADLVQ
jgi:hypothetical protein